MPLLANASGRDPHTDVAFAAWTARPVGSLCGWPTSAPLLSLQLLPSWSPQLELEDVEGSTGGWDSIIATCRGPRLNAGESLDLSLMKMSEHGVRLDQGELDRLVIIGWEEVGGWE